MEFYFSPPSARSVKKLLVWLFFLANIVCIFALWWIKSDYYIHNPGGGNMYIALGRITGLLGEYFLLIQLVMIGRIHWIEGLFGFDRLNKFHRWTGYSILSLLLAHPLLLTLGYAQANGVSFLSQFGDFLANKDNVLLAYISLVLLIFIVIISVVIIRRNLKYETWYFTHLLTYVAIGLALSHQLNTADLRGDWPLQYWYIINFGVFGLVLLYRFIRPLFLFVRHRFYISNIIQETANTWSIYISGKKMSNFAFNSGQYANINILSRGMWQTHPFSFSAPYNGDYIRFSVKNLGDYTSKISDVKVGSKVIVDGPLGLFVSKLSKRDKYLFIAGGIGITPLRSMVEALSEKRKDVSLLYSNRTEGDIIFRKELEDLQTKNHELKIFYILSEKVPGFESGRINKEKIIRLVPDFYEREVFLCGPQGMMESVIQELKEIGFSEDHLHYEKFDF